MVVGLASGARCVLLPGRRRSTAAAVARARPGVDALRRGLCARRPGARGPGSIDFVDAVAQGSRSRGGVGRRVGFGIGDLLGAAPGGFLPPITAAGSDSGVKPRSVRSRSSGERRSPGSGA